MRLKSNKIIPHSLFSSDDPISADDVKNNQTQIKHYIHSSRKHLESLKTKVYKTIDASGLDASVYRIEKTLDNHHVNYTTRPSEFLEKAYATQTFNAQGEGIENRDQPYITAGISFDAYCKQYSDALDAKTALFDDVGKMLAAINAALSMLNKMEANLIKAQADPQEYEYAGGLFPQIPTYINLVLEEAKDSKIIKLIPEQTIVKEVLSALTDIVLNIKKFFSHLGMSKDNIYHRRFEKIQEKYISHEDKTNNEETKNDINLPEKPEPKLP